MPRLERLLLLMTGYDLTWRGNGWTLPRLLVFPPMVYGGFQAFHNNIPTHTSRIMYPSKSILLPLGAVALLGACVPYPEESPQTSVPTDKPDEEQTLSDEQQRQIKESRRRLKEREDRLRAEGENGAADLPGPREKPKKPKYPTALAIPGNPHFVRNPFTQQMVDIRDENGVRLKSGKLIGDKRDPGDPENKENPKHLFRVPIPIP